MAAEPRTEGLLEPRAAHDSLPFAELSSRYNFLNISSYAHVFTNLILEQIAAGPASRCVLDVGCGCGIGRDQGYQWAIRDKAAEFWGIEPDPGIRGPAGLFDNFQTALMETARLPAGHFDLAYSSMVMEHVEDPDAFLAAVHRCLKPGGVYLFVTPNAASLVPRMTQLLHRIRVDETVLRLVKGRQSVEEYHYPVRFRFNTRRQIEPFADRHGFLKPEFAYIEGRGAGLYFPRPLRPIYRLVTLKRRLLPAPQRLATLIGRLTKSGPHAPE
jgi:SAM-dependent methyltransferase